MLNSLSIKNVAVIDSLEVDFNNGLSVLTGETGAGKSIIIDSINMILGVRADRELIRHGCEKAMVQAVFECDDETCKLLCDNDIDVEDNQVIITRTLTAEGKSVAKINGTVVTLSLLRDISGKLVNIHGQHDNQALLTPSQHVSFLDAYAKNSIERDEYIQLYTEMRNIESRLKQLNTQENEKLRRIEMLEYQIKEIETANLTVGEEEDLKEQRDIFANAEKIAKAVDISYKNLYDNDELQSAYDGISIAVDSLGGVSDINNELKNAYNTLSELMYSIEDVAHDLRSFADGIEFNEATLNEIEERLELISKLKRKYGNSIAEIIEFHNKSQAELNDLVMSEEKTKQLLDELEVIRKKLTLAGKKLTDTRKKAAKELENKVCTSLHELNMENSKFSTDIKEAAEFMSDGMDCVEFVISTNPGEPLKPLTKIASGGELSRVMLAIKSALAYADKVDTLIFDEIDTGVSGNAAMKIASKLKEIAQLKQVLCITHLPQPAAAADNHYLIQKDIINGSASTTVKLLDFEMRVEELSRIIDGSGAGELSKQHAREMLKNN